jgi:hypothetical protein
VREPEQATEDNDGDVSSGINPSADQHDKNANDENESEHTKLQVAFTTISEFVVALNQTWQPAFKGPLFLVSPLDTNSHFFFQKAFWL